VSVSIPTLVKIYAAQYDLSGDHCKVGMGNNATKLNAAVFNNTAGNTKLGMYQPKFTGSGYVNFGTGNQHEAMRANLGLADVPVTVSPESGAAGDIAVFMNALSAAYTIGDKVDTILPFTVEASGRGTPAINGRLFVAAGNKTSSSTSSALQLGAVSASQRVYAAIHVLSVSGTNPTLDVTVKSDNGSGFPSPATQLTFAQKTAVGYEFKSAAGAITDDWWRVDWTIGGTATPTFSFVVAVGIFT
jgi:hypothetical protein